MSLHVKLLDIDYPLTFEESKLRQIEAHALIYLSFRFIFMENGNVNLYHMTKFSLYLSFTIYNTKTNS